MDITSDGHAYVYCVMAADGCECVDLHAVFNSHQAAVERAESLQNDPDMIGPTGMYGSRGYAYVQQMEVEGAVELSSASQRGREGG